MIIQSNQIEVPTVFSINTVKSNNNKTQQQPPFLPPYIERWKWQEDDNDDDDNDNDKDSGDIHIWIVAMDFISYGTSTTGTIERGKTYFLEISITWKI